MKKVHNFNAGPCILPDQAIEKSIEALKDFAGTGMAVIEVSHRSKEWGEVMDECRSLWRELLNIPDTHEILFLGGGASMQFLYVAMNFLENKAAYLETGVWAKKALKEAKGIGNAYAVASSADKTYSYIPKGYVIPEDADYFHITTNNTIYGTEIRYDIDSPVPLIADMSSDIMSRPVDVSKYALIYGGAQKNVGPAGVAFAIVRRDALGKRALFDELHIALAVLALGSVLHLPAQRIGDELAAVADAEHGDAQIEDARVDMRRARLVHAVGPAREDDADGRILFDLFDAHVAGQKVAVYPLLAHPAGDQLVVLPAEIQY